MPKRISYFINRWNLFPTASYGRKAGRRFASPFLSILITEMKRSRDWLNSLLGLHLAAQLVVARSLTFRDCIPWDASFRRDDTLEDRVFEWLVIHVQPAQHMLSHENSTICFQQSSQAYSNFIRQLEHPLIRQLLLFTRIAAC